MLADLNLPPELCVRHLLDRVLRAAVQKSQLRLHLRNNFALLEHMGPIYELSRYKLGSYFDDEVVRWQEARRVRVYPLLVTPKCKMLVRFHLLFLLE